MDERLFTSAAGRKRLEAELLPRWMPTCRWFGGKAREVRRFEIAASEKVADAWLLAVRVEYADGTETYAVPLAIGREAPDGIVAHENGVYLFDATHSPEFRAGLFRIIAGSESGSLSGERGSNFASLFPKGAAPESRVLKVEQSNTSIIYGEKLFLKLYRKLSPGENPDAEITRFLSEVAHFVNVPSYCGAVEWNGTSLALATTVIANDGDAWTLALREAGDFFREVGTAGRLDASDAARRVTTGWTDAVFRLGGRIGELHCALTPDRSIGEFEPEPFTQEDGRLLIERIQIEYGELFASLKDNLKALPPGSRKLAEAFIGLQGELREEVGRAVPRDAGLKIRTHGDLHLGQVVCSGGDFIILDFEGEPARTLEERRMKRSPLRDVAGMVRSFHYAAHSTRSANAGLEEHASTWAAVSQASFVAGWKAAAALRLSSTSREWEKIGRLFVLEKTLYEARYELNNRPDWLHIPLRGLLATAR